MGYLLKEALKTLCGINQWSYAVFWKIGSQNPKLLIWEDCYHEPTPLFPPIPGIEGSEPRLDNWEGRWVPAGYRAPRAESKVPALVNAMMLGGQVQVVGQGLVGRTAFTGNHLWILSENFGTGTHPPEVKREVQQQISAGIKTIAIIPVPAHGVVQFGSSSTIVENLAFVNDVQSLVLQLGMIPGVLLSESYPSREVSSKTRVPDYFKTFVEADSSQNYNMKLSAADRSIQQSMPYQDMELVGNPSHSTIRQIGNNLEGTSSIFQTPKVCQNVSRSQNSSCLSSLIPTINPSLPLSNQLENKESRGECISFNPESLNQQASYDYGFGFDDYLISSGDELQRRASNHHLRSSALSSCSLPAEVGMTCPPAGNGGFIASSSQTCGRTSDLTPSQLLSGFSDFGNQSKAEGWSQIVTSQRKERIENDLFEALNIPTTRMEDCTNASENICAPSSSLPKSRNNNDHVKHPSGDDLFDILGVDVKNKLFSDGWNGFLDGVPDIDMPSMSDFTSLNLQDADSDLYMANKGNSSSGVSCSLGSDHLLDAVVNKVNLAAKQSSDDNISCTTAVTKTSGFSLPNASASYGGVSVSNEMKREFTGLPKSLAKFVGFESGPYKSEHRKEDAENNNQSSSIYGSQISSVSELGHSMKSSGGASTAYSKRPEQVSKSNRKRVKPGENPRPRPKDRQMIQDRIKELRDIVPSGAKCSIDALLERTIKHMLFLQSVTKHADKLKQTEDSKVWIIPVSVVIFFVTSLY